MAFFNQIGLNNTSANTGAFNIGTVYVQDATQQEGQSHVELLAQILTELKILNQQIYDLPRIMATGNWPGDSPEVIRQDPTIFNI